MPPKRIILMYISEVSGHHSATLAIEKAVKSLEPESEVLNLNAFNYTNPISERVVNRLYMGVIKRTPKIWDYLYDNPKVADRIKNIKEVIHKFNSPKLKNLFDRFSPDAIVCTQAFPCGMCADYKKTYASNTPLVAVLTDYIPHSYWIYDTIDYYITPAEDVSLRLIQKGVPSEKIKHLGIPFDPNFNQAKPKDELMLEFNLSPKLPTILIMGGGQGLGPIKTVVDSLDKLNKDIQEIVVTGINLKLYKILKRRQKKYRKNVQIFRFTNRIHELMKVSDIIITKPGGVTTAEVLAQNLPMIIINPIPGQEASNANYLTEKGAALKVDRPKDISSVIDQLLDSPDKLEQIRQVSSYISKPDASLDIAKLILGL